MEVVMTTNQDGRDETGNVNESNDGGETSVVEGGRLTWLKNISQVIKEYLNREVISNDKIVSFLFIISNFIKNNFISRFIKRLIIMKEPTEKKHWHKLLYAAGGFLFAIGILYFQDSFFKSGSKMEFEFNKFLVVKQDQMVKENSSGYAAYNINGVFKVTNTGDKKGSINGIGCKIAYKNGDELAILYKEKKDSDEDKESSLYGFEYSMFYDFQENGFLNTNSPISIDPGETKTIPFLCKINSGHLNGYFKTEDMILAFKSGLETEFEIMHRAIDSIEINAFTENNSDISYKYPNGTINYKRPKSEIKLSNISPMGNLLFNTDDKVTPFVIKHKNHKDYPNPSSNVLMNAIQKKFANTSWKFSYPKLNPVTGAYYHQLKLPTGTYVLYYSPDVNDKVYEDKNLHWPPFTKVNQENNQQGWKIEFKIKENKLTTITSSFINKDYNTYNFVLKTNTPNANFKLSNYSEGVIIFKNNDFKIQKNGDYYFYSIKLTKNNKYTLHISGIPKKIERINWGYFTTFPNNKKEWEKNWKENMVEFNIELKKDSEILIEY